MVVADVPGEVVLLDHLAHVLEDLFGGGDRGANPWLEAVAEGVEVAIRADAGVAMHPPGAAEAIEAFEDYEGCAGTLGRQMVGAAHSGDARANNQNVEMLGGCRLWPCKCVGSSH